MAIQSDNMFIGNLNYFSFDLSEWSCQFSDLTLLH